MDNPLRTLLYELFAAPPVRLLQRALDLSVSTAGFLAAYAVAHLSQQRKTTPITTK